MYKTISRVYNLSHSPELWTMRKMSFKDIVAKGQNPTNRKFFPCQ